MTPNDNPQPCQPKARYRHFHTASTSMVPTFEPGDGFVVDTHHYRTHAPRRQELIAIDSPEDGLLWWVERCVALAGDLVEIRDQTFYLNNQPQGACPLPADGAGLQGPDGSHPLLRFGPLRVPEGTVFCLGDNRSNSRDSRFWGPLPVQAIRGKVLYATWPAHGLKGL